MRIRTFAFLLCLLPAAACTAESTAPSAVTAVTADAVRDGAVTDTTANPSTPEDKGSTLPSIRVPPDDKGSILPSV